MSSSIRRLSLRAVLLATAIGLSQAPFARAAATVADLGTAPAATSLPVTIWLKRRNEIGFETALRAMQDPRSPQFRHWMTPAEEARYAPDQASLQTVMAALAQSGLAVTAVSADGQRIDVLASAAAVSRAFATPIHLFSQDGATFAAATATPRLAGRAGTLVAAITGLSGRRAEPFARQQLDLGTGEPVALPLVVNSGPPSAGVSPLNPYLTDNCFDGTTSADLGTAEGFATFTGRKELPGLFEPFADGGGVCGYDATQLRAKYGLAAANASGLDGTGQTVAIIDAYGSPFILSDVNTYSQIEGLPQLGSKNFKIVTPLGGTSTYDMGWSVETTLDVTMVHAIAPKAKIVLLVAPSNATNDLISTFEYGVEHRLAGTFSLSFGEPELSSSGPASADAIAWAFATAQAASYGFGVTVSSGDSGDNGTGTPLGAPNIPADSPYVTAVGGTTLALPTAEGARDVGWGWSATAPNANSVVRTKLQVAALEATGAGGGESAFNEKPYWQSALPGNGREVPDLSAIADPQTGADLVISENVGSGIYQLVSVIGGTSASSPVLAGMSALANQLAGERVGQIAPLLPSLAPGAITDILPFSDREPKITATVEGQKLSTPDVTPQALALLPATDLAIEQIFITHPIFSETILTYGVDTSLTVAKGWDNVTGYGEPNGLGFLQAVASAESAIQMTADQYAAENPSP